MNSQTYDLVTSTCSITADEPVHTMMAHYLSAFHAPEPAEADIALTLNYDRIARPRRAVSATPPIEVRHSHPDQRYQVWATEDHDVLIPERESDHVITVRGDHITVSTEREKVAATIGVRVVRQLIMRGGEARGGRSVHAGAVVVGGHGVLIGGQAGAGKTSVLTRLVEDHGAAALSNDRTMVVPADTGTWCAVGVPLAWRFTPEGIGGSPRLTETLAHRTPRRGSGMIDGKVELTPLEVSQILDSPATPTIPITHVVVLMRSPDVRPETPSARFLRRHMDFAAADFFADDWLGIRPHLPKTTVSQADPDSWWAKLASLPVHVVTWDDPAELARVADAVARGQ
ncbi:hypothetical protein [Nocardia sp. BMG51109]|uniref:hypothetical protein n=1 Tax=Nocardia sp. BMG51109 TaxID=1056816 RepID=UPI000464A679|nr:hypothetical protein [Nocardia sp. BMG51109]